jgi:hypothetical protein
VKRKIGIIVHVGALMDLIVPRSAGFSGCVAWKKLRPSTSRHEEKRDRIWQNKSIMCRRRSHALPERNGGPSQQKPIRRYRLIHIWFLYFL